MKTGIIALRAFLVMTILTGVIYPLLVTGLAQALFADEARGSLITHDGKIVGSKLIAQAFENDVYFHPRPSAAGYDAAASSGSNKGPTNADLKKIYDDGIASELTQDMIFSSGSGLDPHVSPEAAQAQINRIASARHMLPGQRMELEDLVTQVTEGRDFGFLGDPRVNVLKLNLALDKRF